MNNLDPTPYPAGPERTLRVGVLGASGFTGREVCRLVVHHPRLELAFATSRGSAGKRLDQLDPAAPPAVLCDPREADLGAVDAVFVCLPHGSSAETSARVLRECPRVIDLSGDFRLRAPSLHAEVYGSPRDEQLAASAVYGLPELVRSELPGARLVANPGCYPTCTTLALTPLAEAGLLGRGPLVVNAVSGVSGAGATPTDTTHFCSVSDDVRPYKVGRVHRHIAEIEQNLNRLTPGAPPLIFTPHLVPLERGLLVTAVVHGVELGADALRALYAERYAEEHFVRLLPAGESARIRAVAGTNDAVVGLHPAADLDAVVVTCAIDNLLKGAAGQAVQNLNAMVGWPEALGLPSRTPAPTPSVAVGAPC